jgi:hypothetical protein
VTQAALPLDEPTPIPGRAYGRLEHASGRWVLSDIAPHVALRLKDMFRRIPKSQTGRFLFEDTPINCADLEWFAVRYPLTISGRDRAWLAERSAIFRQERDDIEQILLPTWQPSGFTGFRDGKSPFRFQRRPMEIARRLRRLLVLDEGGLGKTITGLGTLIEADCWPAAAIVQPHLATQWRDKTREFTSLRTHVIEGTRPYTIPPGVDLCIFRYSNIAAWVDVAARLKFRSLLWDEIQELRHGEKTGKGAAAKVFTENADLIMGLTATPIYNYGDEIFRVVEYVAPGALGSWNEFLREWCTAGSGGHWIVQNPDALGTYLREQNLALRRTYDDPEIIEELGEALPKPNIIPIEIPHDAKIEADAYELCRQLAIKVVSGSFVERGQAARELDATVRRITGVAKARHVAAYVRMLLQDGEPVLLAGWHREVYDIWNRELADFRPVMYTGSETTTAKDRAKEEFISGKTNLMFISLRSGAGLDGLQQRCNTLALGELDYSPQVHAQLIWRLRRLGQKRWPVNAIYLHSNGGSDPTTVNILGLKASQSRGITDPMAGVEHVHTDESRIKLLAHRYLEQRGGAS